MCMCYGAMYVPACLCAFPTIQICVEFNGMCRIIIGNGLLCACNVGGVQRVHVIRMRVSCTCICTLMRGRERKGEEGKENQQGMERESKRGGKVNEIGSKGVEWSY